MSAAPAIWTETAAIDRWIEPRPETDWACRTCGHNRELHDEGGCLVYEYSDGLPDLCYCKEFI